MKRTLFITGTDTGVGKTFLAAQLTGFLRESGVRAAGLKPVCSGGRDDARALRAAMNGEMALDEINPWHFHAPVAPLLAARREKRRLKLSEALAHVQTMQKRFEILVVEGAGGLLSPLGEHWDSRDLIAALHATPIIVAPDRLGVVNHVLLTLQALPKASRAGAQVVLMGQPEPDASAKTNAKFLAERIDAKLWSLPWFERNFSAAKTPQVRQILRALAGN